MFDVQVPHPEGGKSIQMTMDQVPSPGDVLDLQGAPEYRGIVERRIWTGRSSVTLKIELLESVG